MTSLWLRGPPGTGQVEIKKAFDLLNIVTSQCFLGSDWSIFKRTKKMDLVNLKQKNPPKPHPNKIQKSFLERKKPLLFYPGGVTCFTVLELHPSVC